MRRNEKVAGILRNLLNEVVRSDLDMWAERLNLSDYNDEDIDEAKKDVIAILRREIAKQAQK